MHLDLRTLQLFVAVVEEQRVAQAALREHIAASAVSKRIADLEKEVKVDLFRRHRTGLQPTPAGHALLHHARMLMRDLAQLESGLGDYARGRSEPLSDRAPVRARGSGGADQPAHRQMEREVDEGKRKTMVRQAEAILENDPPLIPIAYEKIYDAWYNKVRGQNPAGFFGIYDVVRWDTVSLAG